VDALNNSGAFGAASTAVLLGDVSGNSNATVNINTAGVTLGRSVVVQTGSSGSKTLGTTITSGLATFSGDVALQDNAALTAPGGGSALFSGNFTGTGGLTLGGGGAITLAAVNSYSGTTTLTGGTLNLNAKALGTNTFTISAVSTLDNTAVSSVTLNDCPQNWNANFTFTGTTNLNLGSGPVTMSSTRTLTVNNSTLTVGGTIAGNGGLVKLGAGTLSIGSPTTNTYTGGTTNSAGVIAINGTASFGDGTGTLALNGGSILNTGSRSGSPIANPVVMSADTTIYGNSTLTSSRILPFSGNWTVAGSTLRVGNIGISNNTFLVRLTAGNNMTWPVVVGDPAFDTPGAISALEFYNDNTTPVQTVTGLIAGNGQVWRGHVTAGLGGTSIFIGNNTYAGGTVLGSGTLGIGNDSTPTSGTLTSGPLGTGTLEIDYDPSLFIYASGGLRTIGNSIFLNSSGNSAFNVVFTGTNALTLTGNVNVGGLPKTLTVSNTAAVTFSGVMTNTAAITKAGPGKLIFSGDNSSRTNNTTVNAGTLLVNNSTGSGTGSGNVTVNSGGTLGGTGTIAGAVTVNAGGTLSAGASIGTLTINSNLTLAGNVVVEVNTSASPSNDLIVVTGVLTNTGTGTITVSNLGPALAVGNNFQIFSGAVANGSALTVTGGGMNWTNRLETDGSIQALSVTTVQTPNFTTGSFSVLPGGNVSLTATGAIGATYKLWATTNLALAPVTNTWTLLQSGTVSANPFTLQDLTATNFPQRFYIFTAP
jgi:autotransporter-associated beta strand protein